MNRKIALVTGATSGIGKATAAELARRGAKVYVGGRREEAGQQVVRDIRAAGGIAVFTRVDVTSEEQIHRLLDCWSSRLCCKRGLCCIEIRT